MVFQMHQYWDVAIDGIQILLCLLILLFLKRSRSRNKRSALKKADPLSGQSFNIEVYTQTLKQHVDQAFANIADAVTIERRNLSEFLANHSPDHQFRRIIQLQSSRSSSTGPEISAIADSAAENDQLHEKIQKMAVKGMSARQISEALKTPLGEVELVLSLGTNLEK